MTARPRGAEAYRHAEALSRSPLELVVMLYDGALRFLAEARDAMARGDLVTRGQALSRALAIVNELQSTLNLERGGLVAEDLDRLYTYINQRLLDVNLKQDATAIDEAHRLLSALRDGWERIASAPPASLAGHP